MIKFELVRGSLPLFYFWGMLFYISFLLRQFTEDTIKPLNLEDAILNRILMLWLILHNTESDLDS